MADSSFILDFVANFEKAAANLETFTKDVSKTVKQIEKDFGGIKLAAFATGLNQGIELAKKLGNALSEPIRQAAEFEADVNSLRIALDATGQATDKTVNGFIDFAAAVQETTKFSDNAVLTTASLIQNLSQLGGRELKTATKAALDLSTALGIDLNSAASLVGKAANGNVAAFKRYGIEVKKGATDSETFANALLLISQRFGGSSEKSVNTFAGAIAQLKNNFDDSLKTFGLVIIQNKTVIETIQLLSAGFIKLTQSIKNNEGIIGTLVNKGFLVLNAVLKNIVPLFSVAAVALAAYAASVAASTIAVLGFSGALQYATIGLRALAASAYAALVPLAPFIAAGAIIAGITAFAVKVYLIRDSFVSFQDAAKGAALELGIFVTEFFGLTSIAEKFKGLLDALKQKKIDLDTGDAMENFHNLDAAAKNYRKNLDEIAKEREIAANKERAQFEETATANFDKIKEALAKAGKSEYELIVLQKEEQLKVLKDYGSLGDEQAKVANALRLNVEEDFNNKRGELNKKSNEYWAGEAEKTLAKEQAKIDSRNKAIAGSVTATISGVQQGAAGVAGVASSLLSSLGPYGQAAGAALSFLAQGPEAVRAQLQGFIDGIPTIIDAIAESIPVVIEVLAANAGKITTALSLQMPFVANTLAIELVKQSPFIAISFVNSLINEAGRLITAISEGVKQAISKVTGFGGGGGGGALGAVINPVGFAKKKLGFAEGGIVPNGFPNDGFNAKLTSGEGVIPVDTMRRLDQYLSAADGRSSNNNSGGGTTIIKLIVGEQELANVMLGLNQRGFRLT